MKSQEIFNLLEKIELNLDLDLFQLFKIDIWPHLRNKLVINLSTESTESNINNNNYLQRIWIKLILFPRGLFNFLCIYINDYKNNDTANSERDYFFLSTSADRRMHLPEGYYNVYFDPIVDHYNNSKYSYIDFETSRNFDIKYPRYRPSKLIQFSLLWRYIRSLLIIFSTKENNQLNKIYSILKKEFIKHDIIKYLPAKLEIKLELSYIYQLSNYFRKWLVKIKPRIVFIETYYGFVGMGLCHACKLSRIKAVDVQHGVQGIYHYAYSSFNKIPLTGYNVMPDIFLTWSENEKDIIQNWAKQTSNVCVYAIGNANQQMFLTNNLFSEYFDKLFGHYYSGCNNKIKILITLGGRSPLPEIIYKLIKESSGEYFYFIRFHPCATVKEKKYVKTKLTEIINHNFELDIASELPIYSLLRNINVHLTEYSSVVIEAESFNIKSIIIDEEGRACYEDYINNGSAYYCEDTDQIFKVIDNIVINKNNKQYMNVGSSSDSFSLVLDSLIK